VICAPTLSPSVTATSRMLSPKRAMRSRWASCQPRAARIQMPMRSCTSRSDQWPTTVLRVTPIRLSM